MKLRDKLLDYAINFCVVSVGQTVGMGLYQSLRQAYYMATWKPEEEITEVNSEIIIEEKE